jgi:hypothetical protein
MSSSYCQFALPRNPVLAFLCVLFTSSQALAQPLVPGTGQLVPQAIDDFEDPNWAYVYNAPKSSNENDKQTRGPTGTSRNGKFFEPALRGQPDFIQRVETPPGGLPGSTGAMMIATRDSGVPGRPSRSNQQDDLIARMGGAISVSRSPSVVVRVYLPPFEEWQPKTGNSFGFRASCFGRRPSNVPRKRGSPASDTYWPGFFIHFTSKNDRRTQQDYAALLIRSDQRGADFWGPRIDGPGWWTLGMSFTPDGQVHYYAKAGVEDLTAEDYLASHYCYGFRCQRLETYFFDVVSPDDGKTWSTKWIVDDPMVYVAR